MKKSIKIDEASLYYIKNCCNKIHFYYEEQRELKKN